MQRRQLFKMTGALIASSAILPSITLADSAAPPPSKDTLIKLNFNENSLGVSPKARQAIIDSIDIGFRYPDDQRAALIDQIAKDFEVSKDFISLGNGSSENIQGIVQSQIEKARAAGKKVQLITPAPTFSYAKLYAKGMGVPVEEIPVKEDLSFDIEKMRQLANDFNGNSIFYLCNPNNPTSTITPAETLFSWINASPENHFFLLDEAYAEFVTDKAFESGIKLIKAGKKNVAITRTFSKLYALAGYRMGYAIAQPEIIAEAESLMSLDNTNVAGAVAALASMQDAAFLEKSIKNNEQSRKIVLDTLDELGLKYAASNGNFVFHEIKGEVKIYQQRMKENHIIVGREFPPLKGWNRLTLGRPDEMQQFVKVLKQFREKGWV